MRAVVTTIPSLNSRALKLSSCLFAVVFLLIADLSAETPHQNNRQRELVEGWNDPTQAFDGWNSMYDGYARTPILFDPMPSAGGSLERKYPELMWAYGTACKGGCKADDNRKRKQMNAQRSIASLNLGVDDEIYKTTMQIYRPIRWMEKDFSQSETDRDDNLELFQSVRGIANLTLSYLDKTVAAGLATTQHQLDNKLTNHLLKQITWTNSQIANPNREQLYLDTDQKVEACMQSIAAEKLNSGDSEDHKGTLSDPRLGGFLGELGGCIDKCGAPTREGGFYSFCICCAESSFKLAPGLADGECNPNDKHCTLNPDGLKTQVSIVDKVFFGKKLPKKGNPKGEFLRTVVNYFKFFYGDVEYQTAGPDADYYGATDPRSQIPFETKNPTIGVRYRLPERSVAQRIRIFRNGECSGSGGSDQTIACPITGTMINYGICPAMKAIVSCWHQPPGTPVPKNTGAGEGLTCPNTPEEWWPLWIEASLGKVFSARDIESWGRAFDITFPLPANFWENEPEEGYHRKDLGYRGAKRWIDVFCDSSSVVAFKRFHLRMDSLLEDHMALNRWATDNDKTIVKNLSNRIDRYLMLAEADAEADFRVDSHLIGIGQTSDRKRQADIASSATGNKNWQNHRNTTSGFTIYGGQPRYYRNGAPGNGAGGGGNIP